MLPFEHGSYNQQFENLVSQYSVSQYLILPLISNARYTEDYIELLDDESILM